ncbi:MAG TPA: hypothetical protein VFE34_10510 [Dongiaceae bacterium]|nr:hypothetical protein [Dongiaceae bacterium]
MPTTTVIFLGLLFTSSTIAAGVVASDLRATQADDPGPGVWHISAGPDPAVWKLNTQTGALYYCTRSKSCSLVAD